MYEKKIEIKLQICHHLIQLEREVERRESRQLDHQQRHGCSGVDFLFCFYHDAVDATTVV